MKITEKSVKCIVKICENCASIMKIVEVYDFHCENCPKLENGCGEIQKA